MGGFEKGSSAAICGPPGTMVARGGQGQRGKTCHAQEETGKLHQVLLAQLQSVLNFRPAVVLGDERSVCASSGCVTVMEHQGCMEVEAHIVCFHSLRVISLNCPILRLRSPFTST